MRPMATPSLWFADLLWGSRAGVCPGSIACTLLRVPVSLSPFPARGPHTGSPMTWCHGALGSRFLTFLALMTLAVWGHFAECPSIWVCLGFSSWLWVLGGRFPSSDLGFETRSLAAQTVQPQTHRWAGVAASGHFRVGWAGLGGRRAAGEGLGSQGQ